MSVQSIIVFVLAFIVLGILIALIQGMFDPLKTQIKRLPLSVDLGVEPTVDRPIVVENGELKIDYGRESPARFAFYYDGDNTKKDGALVFKIVSCENFDIGLLSIYDEEKKDLALKRLPEILGRLTFTENSPLKPGDSLALDTLVKENKLDRGNYLCTMEAWYYDNVKDSYKDPYGEKKTDVLATSTFRLEVQ